jgi:putative transposase
MNRRKPELQAIDLATWPGIAWTDLDTEARKVIRQRMHALELFVQGEPVHAIEKSTGVNRRQLYRWLERGLSLHPDGCIFGFRALQPHSRVIPYARLTGVVVQGERGSRGTAGAFSQLLERYPMLATWLRLQVKRRRLTLDQIHTDGRLHTRLRGLQPLHVAFLQECPRCWPYGSRLPVQYRWAGNPITWSTSEGGGVVHLWRRRTSCGSIASEGVAAP